MKIIKNGVTAPKGFKANGVRCGLKKNKKLKDLALIYSDVPAVTEGVFTKNEVKAAPLLVSQKNLRDNFAQAVVVNSGNANCCTGKQGLKDAQDMASFVADSLNISKNNVLVASTGIIGKVMDMRRIRDMLPLLVKGLSKSGYKKAAEAILTTDKLIKQYAVEIKINNKIVKIGAMAKGSGMVCPDMATMLAFITTDVHITRQALKEALKKAVDSSFNLINIDNDMSTNDMVLLMANGMAGNKPITKNSSSFKIFTQALSYLTLKLAHMMVRDGEGATKFIEITVEKAKSYQSALKTAKRISNSFLVKTAVYGHNPNWGRIIAAAGAAGININQKKVDVYLGDTKKCVAVFKKGETIKNSPKLLKSLFSKRNVKIVVKLNTGKSKAVVWTSDLSKKYVAINSEYPT